eukprot:gene5938-4247_t
MILKKFAGAPMRTAQRAAELLPADQRWCTLCHVSVLKKAWPEHLQSRGHRLANRKMNKMKRLSLTMWERHRGAPLEEASPREADFEAELARYQRQQKTREEEFLRQLWDDDGMTK